MAIDLAAELEAVCDLFRPVDGIDSVSTDPSEVIAPGILVQLVGIGPATFAHRELQLQLLLVVPDTGPGAPSQLGALLTAVETIASADGTILARSVVLPAQPTTPLPGLVFPLNHFTTQEA
jgi:hypothetical protein